MKVLALCSYPIEAAATRYRLEQFVGPLAERDIELTIRPFLDSKLFELIYQRDATLKISAGLLRSSISRIRDVFAAARADAVIVQREAMIFGPPVVEWLASRICKTPMVLDLDDATYVPYTSPTFGNLGRRLKWFRKTDDLIRWSQIVTCGNQAIAEYVSSKGATVCVVPTVVDTEVFQPVLRVDTDTPVLGWIGTHSTFPYLESIFPVLQELAKNFSFRLKIVGAGKEEIILSGVEVENLRWQLHREVEDFQAIDIGLYPIDEGLYAEKWAAGKSGFKAIQYMAVGIPYVATPVGGAGVIGEEGLTHFCAWSREEWRQALEILLSDPQKRLQMGAAGRRHVIKHYGMQTQAENLATVFSKVTGRR